MDVTAHHTGSFTRKNESAFATDSGADARYQRDFPGQLIDESPCKAH